MKKVAFCTLGCKVNQYETNAMKEKLIHAQYEMVPFDEKADIYIINTCTVTNISDKKSRQMMRRAKQMNPNAIVVAVGCYAQVAKEKLKQIEEVDLILGNNEKQNIVEHLKNVQTKRMLIDDVMHQKEFVDFGTTTYMDKTRAVVKVQDGCDRFCSYCIIPYARGRVRSRKIESVVEEIQALASQGIKEVVITGIHIASYGKDFQEKIGLIDLLEKIHAIKGIERIRLGSLEPTMITDTFLERLSQLEKICHHFHLSLQSGCDATLKRMNRTYSTKEFEEVVHRLRKQYQDVILTTDIIVGFPGETQQEFEQTYHFLEKIQFYKMHIFPYSRRQGTKADQMQNQIAPQQKEERSKKLIQLSNQNQHFYHLQYIGKTVEVLLEEQQGDTIKGHTANYLMVAVPKEKIETSHQRLIKVKIIGETLDYLQGTLV